MGRKGRYVNIATMIEKQKRIVKVKDQVMNAVESYGHEIGMNLVYQFGKLLHNGEVEGLGLKKLIQAGNIKVPSTTCIFNMGSATDCPSLSLGLCKATIPDGKGGFKSICYASKSEKSYRPDVLPYRRRQEEFWKSVSPEQWSAQFLLINSIRKNKFDKVRFNESGDFWSQDCVRKAESIARILFKFGITCYCYTSRSDLDFSNVRKLIINGSSFKKKGIINEFVMVRKGEVPPKGYGKCASDCKVCNRCSIRGKKTYVLEH
jgi:hypothetical protein